jgi:hypothetical protein
VSLLCCLRTFSGAKFYGRLMQKSLEELLVALNRLTCALKIVFVLSVPRNTRRDASLQRIEVSNLISLFFEIKYKLFY